MEFSRLDSTYKGDSALVAAGKKSKALLDRVAEDRRKMGLNLVYWQQIAQNKSNNKRSQLAQPLYEVVAGAYKRILAKKNMASFLNPRLMKLVSYRQCLSCCGQGIEIITVAAGAFICWR